MSVKLRKRKSGSGTQTLYLDIHVKGHARSRSALGMFIYTRPKDQLQKKHNEETIRQATEKAANTQLELQAQNNNVRYSGISKVNFEAYFQTYIDNYQNKDKNKFISALYHFKKHKGMELFHLSQKFVDGYKHYLSNSAGLSGETPSVYIKKFKKICGLAYADKVIQVNPAQINFRLKFDKHSMRKEVLTEQELKVLYKHPCPDALIGKYFTWMLNTGLRPGDASGLLYKDVMNGKLKIEQGKTGIFVFVDLNQAAKAILDSLQPLKPDDKLFAGLPSDSTVRGKLKEWCENAGLTKHITTYCARHTYCTLLMRKKNSSKTIISLMGWDEESGLTNLMRYAHFVDEDAKAAVDSLPAMDLSKLLK